MMKNGNYFSIIICFMLVGNLNLFSQRVFTSFSLGASYTGAFGYTHKTKPILVFPSAEISSNLSISKKNNHWVGLAFGVRKKGVKYSYNSINVKHVRSYFFLKANYKYKLNNNKEAVLLKFVTIGVDNGAVILYGSKTSINDKTIPFSNLGQYGFRNWSISMGFEGKYKKLGFSFLLNRDINSFNVSSFRNDPKIYFGSIIFLMGYYI